jgi:hypothetical protein
LFEPKEKIGGLDVEIQIEETAICNGQLVTDSSNTLDSTPKTQWIIGGVEKNDLRNLFLFLAPNREKESIL